MKRKKITPKEPAREMSAVLVCVAENIPPAEFAPLFIGGIIANVAASLPEPYWQKLCEVKPCGVPGCDCHLTIQLHGIALLKLLRQDHRNFSPHEKTITE
jgi:hypothetical protein